MWILPQVEFCVGYVVFEATRRTTRKWRKVMYNGFAHPCRNARYPQTRLPRLGNLLRGGGGGGVGANDTARNMKEADFLSALHSLISSKFDTEGESTNTAPSGSTKNNKHARRKEQRLLAKEAGFFGEIKKIADTGTTKQKSVGEVMNALKNLIARHSDIPQTDRRDRRPSEHRNGRDDKTTKKQKAPEGELPEGEGADQDDATTPAPPPQIGDGPLERDGGQRGGAHPHHRERRGQSVHRLRTLQHQKHGVRQSPARHLRHPHFRQTLGQRLRRNPRPRPDKAGILKIAKLCMTCKGPSEAAWQKWGPKAAAAAIAKHPETTIA